MSCNGNLMSKYISGLGQVALAFQSWNLPGMAPNGCEPWRRDALCRGMSGIGMPKGVLVPARRERAPFIEKSGVKGLLRCRQLSDRSNLKTGRGELVIAKVGLLHREPRQGRRSFSLVADQSRASPAKSGEPRSGDRFPVDGGLDVRGARLPTGLAPTSRSDGMSTSPKGSRSSARCCFWCQRIISQACVTSPLQRPGRPRPRTGDRGGLLSPAQCPPHHEASNPATAPGRSSAPPLSERRTTLPAPALCRTAHPSIFTVPTVSRCLTQARPRPCSAGVGSHAQVATLRVRATGISPSTPAGPSIYCIIDNAFAAWGLLSTAYTADIGSDRVYPRLGPRAAH